MERIYGKNLQCESESCICKIQIRATAAFQDKEQRKLRKRQLEGTYRKVLDFHPMSDPPKRLTKDEKSGAWLCDNCFNAARSAEREAIRAMLQK